MLYMLGWLKCPASSELAAIMTQSIDLNSDLGESYGAWTMGDDGALLDVVSSANLACGFHAGDALTMRGTIRKAKQRGVTIGAHVAYPDLQGFGRRYMDVPAAQLTADVIYQIGALQALARAEGAEVAYVKPHGALYNRIAIDPVQAGAVLEAMKLCAPGMPLVVLAGSALLGWAKEAGVPTIAEAFADRGVMPDGQLAPRSYPGAVLTDPEAISQRVIRLVREGTVTAIDGSTVSMPAQSICLHGDTPHAVEIARAVARSLREAGIAIKAVA